jgi:hypothetical protein
MYANRLVGDTINIGRILLMSALGKGLLEHWVCGSELLGLAIWELRILLAQSVYIHVSCIL